MIVEKARAKINLALHVTGQRDDGFHLLHSPVVFAERADELSFQSANAFSLRIDGPFAHQLSEESDNLVLRAARRLADYAFAQTPDLAPPAATITLTKNLPVASGIGGGSADAAATLRGLVRFWLSDLRVPAPVRAALADRKALSQIALGLGADVPMCLGSEPTVASGIGEILEPFSPPSFSAVLVTPPIAVSTPSIFKTLTSRQNPPLAPLPENEAATDWIDWLKNQRNDLQQPACALHPIIDATLTCLDERGARLARMSGSGATCFGLFASPDAAKKAALGVAAAHPDFFVCETTLVGASHGD